MRSRLGHGVVAACLIALAGCASTPAPQATTAEPTSQTSSSSVAPDDLESCRVLFDGGKESLVWHRVPDALTGVEAKISQERADEMVAIHEEFVRADDLAASWQLSDAIADLDKPFAKFAKFVEGGGGEVHLDTSRNMQKTTTLMTLCAEAGYQVEGKENMP